METLAKLLEHRPDNVTELESCPAYKLYAEASLHPLSVSCSDEQNATFAETVERCGENGADDVIDTRDRVGMQRLACRYVEQVSVYIVKQ